MLYRFFQSIYRNNAVICSVPDNNLLYKIESKKLYLSFQRLYRDVLKIYNMFRISLTGKIGVLLLDSCS